MDEFNNVDRTGIILEQYKLFVEMADRASQRRIQTNQYYAGLLSGLLFVVAFVMDKNSMQKEIKVIEIILSIFGILLCIIWQLNILSYKKLNNAKFTVIKEIEKKLPISCFGDEWDILIKSKKRIKYISISVIENFIPALMLLVFIILFIYLL